MPEMLDENGRSVEVIDGDIEVPLNLRRVQVEGQCAACAGGLEKVGDELCRYRNARLILAVLARVAVIRQHRSNTPSRGALEGINHQEQLEQVIVDRVAARLNDEHIRAAHVFENLEINLAVAEASQPGLAKRHFQMAANALRQRQIRVPRENFKSVVVHDTRAPSARSWAGMILRPRSLSWPTIWFSGDAADQRRQ